MVEKKDRDARDVSIGRNLAELRGDTSQGKLASQMRERGWKWSQATVWAVERGDRPLRLAEAVDALELLGAPRHLLEGLLDGDSGRFLLHHRLYRAKREREALMEHALAYYRTRDELVALLGELSAAELEQLSAIDRADAAELLGDEDDLQTLLTDAHDRRRLQIAVDGNSWPDERVLTVGSERIDSDRAAREALLQTLNSAAAASGQQ